MRSLPKYAKYACFGMKKHMKSVNYPKL